MLTFFCIILPRRGDSLLSQETFQIIVLVRESTCFQGGFFFFKHFDFFNCSHLMGSGQFPSLVAIFFKYFKFINKNKEDLPSVVS